MTRDKCTVSDKFSAPDIRMYCRSSVYSAWHLNLQPGMNVLYDSSVQQLIVTWIYGISSVHSTWHQHLRPWINVLFLFSVQRLTSVLATRVSVAVIAQDVSFILHSTRNSYGWKDNTIGTDFSEVVSKNQHIIFDNFHLKNKTYWMLLEASLCYSMSSRHLGTQLPTQVSLSQCCLLRPCVR